MTSLHNPKIEGEITGLTYSADGKLLLAADEDALCVWNAKTGRRLSRVEPEKGDFDRVVFSPDGRLALLTTENLEDKPDPKDPSDPKGEPQLREQRERGNPLDREKGPGFLEDLPVRSTGEARLVDVKTGKEVRRLEGNDDVSGEFSFSPDGRSVAIANEKTLLIWDVTSGKKLGRFNIDGDSGVLMFSKDSRMLATTIDSIKVQLFTIRK